MTYKFSEKVSHLQASAIREILKFTADPEVISFAAGNPSPEAFPVDELNRISEEIFKENPIGALQYSLTEGYTPLRDLLKKELEKKGEFDPERDDLIIRLTSLLVKFSATLATFFAVKRQALLAHLMRSSLTMLSLRVSRFMKTELT